MYIGEFAEKYMVTKREVLYWIDLGLIHPKTNEQNNYYTFDEDNEKEVKRVIIMKAAGIALDVAHLGFVRLIPDDMWNDIIVRKIIDNKNETDEFYEKALEYAKE